jgi:hypothetical protein
LSEIKFDPLGRVLEQHAASGGAIMLYLGIAALFLQVA